MSDFGANIFDDRHPAPAPTRARKRSRRAPAEPVEPPAPTEPPAAPPPQQPPEPGPVAAAEPPRVEEVPLSQPSWVHDDAQAVLFEAPAPAPACEVPAQQPRADESVGRAAEPVAEPTECREPAEPRARERRDDEPERLEPWRNDDRRPADRGHGAWRQDRRGGDDRARARPAPDRRGGEPGGRPRPDHSSRPRQPVTPAAGDARAAQSVAILVDLLALQAEARSQGGELALHRLRRGVVGDRACTKAVCYAPRGSTPPNGFELRPNTDNVGGIGIAAAALELVADGSLLVLAPPSPAIRQLATALRKAGHQVELAGFLAGSDDVQPMRRLGRDCLFVP